MQPGAPMDRSQTGEPMRLVPWLLSLGLVLTIPHNVSASQSGQTQPGAELRHNDDDVDPEDDEETEVVEEETEVVEEDVVETDDGPSLLDQARQQAATASRMPPPARKFPRIEWHGYFRARTDLITEADLGTFDAISESEYTGTSLFLPALTRNFVNDDGNGAFKKVGGENEKTIGTANLRLRLSPVFHISDTVRIHTTIDLLDNIVLGSTPDYMSAYPHPFVPIDTMTLTQIPPSSGVNSFQDSFTVKEAWAEWNLAFVERLTPDAFTLGTLRIGRYAFDWGLGIYSSSGDYRRADKTLTTQERMNALDTDWGNYTDRFSWTYDFNVLRLMVGYSWMSSGIYSQQVSFPTWAPYDLGDADDVKQVELAIYSRPETKADFDKYRKKLFSGKPVLNWGLYATYRFQQKASWMDVESAEVLLLSPLDSIALTNRDAWILTSDLWLEMDWQPTPENRFYIGFEGVMSVGSIGNVAGPGLPERSLDILTYGAALESQFTLGQFGFGLDAGLASGDDGEVMGTYRGLNNSWGNDGSNYGWMIDGSDNLEVNPQFTDAQAGDFTLDPGFSPCIDAGSPLSGYNDPDGSRNDMGAYGGPFGSW